MTRALVVFLIVLGSVNVVSAQRAHTARPSAAELDDARRYFEQGVALSDQQRWGEAIEFFRRSALLVERPSTLFNLSAAFMRVGQPVEALSACERYLVISDPHSDADQRVEVQRVMSEARVAMAYLRLRVQPDHAEVRIDNIPVARAQFNSIPLNPGRHAITVSAEGRVTWRTDFAVLTGERSAQNVELQMAPTPREAASTIVIHDESRPVDDSGGRSVFKSPWFWAITGVVVAGAVVAVLIATQQPSAPDGGNTNVVVPGLVAF